MNKYLLAFIFVLIPFRAFSIDFQSYETYKSNDALLSSDIERLENKLSKNNDKILVNTLAQFKLLQENYKLLNSRLTLKTFIKDANENGWKETVLKTQLLLSVCEGSEIDLHKCLTGLKKLKYFISNSKLNVSNKESINSFYDNYIAEATKLASFDDAFILKFNENVIQLNAKFLVKNILPAIVVKISPSKHKLTPPTYKKRINYKAISLIIVGAVLFSLMILAASKQSNKRKTKSYYSEYFRVARENHIKLKLFGSVENDKINIAKKIQGPLLGIVSSSRFISKETHLYFKSKKSSLHIDAIFHSSSAIKSSLTESEASLKHQLDLLQITIADLGGEINYSNVFNTFGVITHSKILISLSL